MLSACPSTVSAESNEKMEQDEKRYTIDVFENHIRRKENDDDFIIKFRLSFFSITYYVGQSIGLDNI